MREKLAFANFALLVLGIGIAHAEPVKIRGSWVAPLADWGSIWLDKKDLARHFGKSYVFESTRYAGTPPMITALANNELDIANLAFTTLPIAIVNAGMSDIRVIADDFQDGVGDYHTSNFQVLADGPIRKVEDLKGKVLATVAAGSAIDVVMRAKLRAHGLEANRDYTVIEAPLATMRVMLAEKKVDLIPGVLPFSLDPELKKIGRPLFSSKEAVGVTQFASYSVRKPFIDKHRAVLVDFLEDTLRIMNWYQDPANQKAAAEIAARMTKRPADQFGWLFTKNDYYRDPNLLPNLGALQKNVDMVKSLGFVKASIDVNAHSDLSLVKEAAQRLKR